MPLSATDRDLIQRFRDDIERRYASDARFAGVSRHDRDDESTLQSRFEITPHLWIEACIRPFLPQFRAGIMTDDRWLSEELEEAIEETGDEMGEFIEAGFDEVGLSMKNPQVEHYRDQGKYFYFATPIDLAALADLTSPKTIDTAMRMLDGYFEAFRSKIERLKSGAKA